MPTFGRDIMSITYCLAVHDIADSDKLKIGREHENKRSQVGK